ncbi:MAG: hypothetical protein IT445_18165 [Phycisphaeraceae bacterium]|nr:hypothetical protein [Phycisphaeraceae bacterium]
MDKSDREMKYNWIEVGAKFHSPEGVRMCRHRYATVDDAATIAAWRARFDNRDVFTSVCLFPEADNRGPGICPLYLDIDGKEGREQARDQALKVIELLADRLGLHPETMDIFFSGHKGFHIEVPLENFGEPKDSRLIYVWHQLAKRLVKEGLNCVDSCIYQYNRLWRMVNSQHGMSDLFKVAIEHGELQDGGMSRVLELAQFPREFESFAKPRECPKAIGWCDEALAWHEQRRRRKNQTTYQGSPQFRGRGWGWRRPPCVRYVEQQAVLEDGTRHAVYQALVRFYASIGMHPEEMIEQLGIIDARNPIRDPDYIERLVRQDWKYPGITGCPNEALAPYCQAGGCFLMRSDKRHE